MSLWADTHLVRSTKKAHGFGKNRLAKAKRSFVLALPIFPASHPASIVGADELNFCVRDGNRWTLVAIKTNLRRLHKAAVMSKAFWLLTSGAPSGTRTRDPLIKSQLLYQLS